MIVQPIAGETRKRSSGLVVPTQLSDRFVGAVIHSVSDDVGRDQFGLSEGQRVLYDKHAGYDVKGVDGVSYKVISCRDIAVIL